MPMDVLITEYKTVGLSDMNFQGSKNTLTVVISVINSWAFLCQSVIPLYSQW